MLCYGTLAVDGWAVTFGTARRGLGRFTAEVGTLAIDGCINGQSTNFVLFSTAL